MRPLLFVLLSALLLVGCRPTPSDPIQYLHREDSIIIQMLSFDADTSEVERRLSVPEFTLYGDGTLIYQSATADGTRLLQTKLPAGAVQELLENIVDEGFLNFIYEQPAPEGASGPTTFIYAHTRDLANAVSVRSADEPLPEDAGDKFDQYRTVIAVVEALRALDLTALGGTEATAYVAEQYVMVVRTLDGSSDLSERIVQATEIAGVLESKGVPKSTLEEFAGPIATSPEGRPPQEIYYAPLLPFYENFPEFNLQ